MTFTIIGIIVAAVATLLLGIYSDREYSEGAFADSIISGAAAAVFAMFFFKDEESLKNQR